MLIVAKVTPQVVTSDFRHRSRNSLDAYQHPTHRLPTQQQQLDAVCYQLAKLQAENVSANGWLLVVAPPTLLNKSMLAQLGISPNRILLIQQKQIHHFDNLMRDALTCSTCSAVMSFLPVDHPQLAEYEYLSKKYGTDFYNQASLPVTMTH